MALQIVEHLVLRGRESFSEEVAFNVVVNLEVSGDVIVGGEHVQIRGR